MKRVAVAIAVALMAGACASDPSAGGGGPRPPQGAGPAGTQFGFWDRDADAAVDADFRSFITRTYSVGDEVRAKAALTQDGFNCTDGPGADGKAPKLSCERLYRDNDIIHTWTVDFVANDRAPRAHYSRVQRRDDLRKAEEKRKGK
jgi:hypothetical protein